MNDYSHYAPDLLAEFTKNSLASYMKPLGLHSSTQRWKAFSPPIIENLYYAANSIWDTSPNDFQSKNLIKRWKNDWTQAPLYALGTLKNHAQFHLSKTPLKPSSASYASLATQLERQLPPAIICARGFFVHFEGLSPTSIFIGNIFDVPQELIEHNMQQTQDQAMQEHWRQFLNQTPSPMLLTGDALNGYQDTQMQKLNLLVPFSEDGGIYFLLNNNPETAWICPLRNKPQEPSTSALHFYPPGPPPSSVLDPLLFLTSQESHALFKLILKTPLDVFLALQEHQNLEESLPISPTINSSLRRTL